MEELDGHKNISNYTIGDVVLVNRELFSKINGLHKNSNFPYWYPTVIIGIEFDVDNTVYYQCLTDYEGGKTLVKQTDIKRSLFNIKKFH